MALRVLTSILEKLRTTRWGQPHMLAWQIFKLSIWFLHGARIYQVFLLQSTGVQRSMAVWHQFRHGFARSFVLAVCQGTLKENESGHACGKSVAKQKCTVLVSFCLQSQVQLCLRQLVSSI